MAVERLVKNKKFALKFASSAFLRFLWWGPRQRPLTRWFHPQLWLAHLNFSANARGRWIWARAQILNGPIRVEDETTLRTAVVADPITSTSGKPKSQILRQIFRSSQLFQPPKHTYLEWNLLGSLELLFLLWLGTFPVDEKGICGVTPDQRCTEWSAFPFF